MLRVFLLLSLAFGLYQSAAAGVVRIGNGDCTGLANAANGAAQSASITSIILARGGNYSSCGISVTGGNVDIDAQGATLQMFSASVAINAQLAIRNGSLTGPADGGAVSTVCPPAFYDLIVIAYTQAICNNGVLNFDHVTFSNWKFPQLSNPQGIGGQLTELISSAGNLALRNVTFSGIEFDSAAAGPLKLIDNSGTTEIFNSTLAIASAPYAPIASNTMVSANSIFMGAGGAPICTNSTNALKSLGGNVATDSSCGFSSSTGDKIVSSLSLAAAGYHGGLVPTVQIGFGDPAYRVGVVQYCEATDARGVTRNGSNCDAGAYESGGGLGLVTSNGMNGIYYVPGIANGHYVSVQRIHDNGDVMLFWDTFDRNGDQAWIYGIGTLTSDRHIHAQMTRNVGGVLQPGGPATGAQASPWGAVDIDVTNCSAAQFNYESDLPEFGSGQFPLTRLAFESAINCGD